MKTIIRSLLLNSVLMGALLTSAQLKAQSVEAAKQNVKDSKEQLKEAKLNAEYPAFKKEQEQKIAANDKQVAELRSKLAQPGKSAVDDMRRKKIGDLEKRNADLRNSLVSYEKKPTDWMVFKTKFNQDADKLRDAFRDFGNDLKKKN
jgi:hypothetical protein